MTLLNSDMSGYQKIMSLMNTRSLNSAVLFIIAALIFLISLPVAIVGGALCGLIFIVTIIICGIYDFIKSIFSSIFKFFKNPNK